MTSVGAADRIRYRSMTASHRRTALAVLWMLGCAVCLRSSKPGFPLTMIHDDPGLASDWTSEGHGGLPRFRRLFVPRRSKGERNVPELGINAHWSAPAYPVLEGRGEC